MHDIPRCEHPGLQMQRLNWMNLNGEWEYDVEQEVIGLYTYD